MSPPLPTPPRMGWWRRLGKQLQRRPEVTLSPIALVVIIALWHLATTFLAIPIFILPPPVAVWDALLDGLSRGPFDQTGLWYHTAITTWEALLGFVIGSAVGTVLGFAIAQSRVAERIVYPYIVGFQSLPKVALAPLLVIWFGFGLEGKVIITSVITFFPLLVNSMAGYHGVDPDRIDLARSCNASSTQILWKIVLPSSLPFLFAGLNVASVLAILGAIVGEFVGARAGLGMLLLQYDQSMQIAPVFAVLLILGLVGYLMNWAIKVLERRFCFWAHRLDHAAGAEA
jgi:NitT/TauT family transport system permease protein